MRTSRSITWKKKECNQPPQNTFSQNLLYGLVMAGLTLLCLFCGLKMLYDVFPTMHLSLFSLIVLFFLILLLTVWSNLSENPIRDLWIQSGVILVLFLMLIYLRFEDLQNGLTYVIQLYLENWNDYYQLNLPITRGYEEFSSLAVYCIVLPFFTLLLILAIRTCRLWILLFFPCTILALELLVGKEPGWVAISAFFICMLFFFSRSWQKQRTLRQLPLLLCLSLLLVVLTSLCFQKPASTIIKHEDRMLAFQHKLEQNLLSFDFATLFNQENTVDNHTPIYQNTEVLSIASSTSPVDNVYLRDFYGIDYSSRGWSSQSDTFNAACQAHDITPEKASLLLAQLSFDNQRTLFPDYFHEINYQLSYTSLHNSYSYVPYCSNVESLSNTLSFANDFDLQKSWSRNYLKVTGANETFFPLFSSTYTPTAVLSVEEKNFCDWYNRYALEQYCSVPKDQTTARSIAEELNTDWDVITYQEYAASDTTYMANYGRILLADHVAKYLASTASYSQKLDAIDSTTDPVDYFLSTSKKGYCVHFASAGTLILRSLGVPCRYVTGYVARSNAFKKLDADAAAELNSHWADVYSCSVKDSDAHAWVEIYLNNYGWMPVDMTPGVSDDNLSYRAVLEELTGDSVNSSTPPDSMDTSDDSTEIDEAADSTSAPEPPTPEDSDSDSSDSNTDNLDDANLDNTNIDNANSTGSNIEGSATGNGSIFSDHWFSGNWNVASWNIGNWFSGRNDGTDSNDGADASENESLGIPRIFLPLSVIVLLALFVAVLTAFLRFLKQHKQLRQQKRLERYLHHKQPARGVRLINQDMYKTLLKTRHSLGRKLSDQDYLKALIDTFPQVSASDWNTYLMIVQKAAYSRETLTEAERQHVYDTYVQCLKVINSMWDSQ